MLLRCFHIIFIAVFFPAFAPAQNIAGIWEGILDGDELLQIHIVQKKLEICGYTYDHILNEPADYCRANFSGYYDGRKEAWLLTGTGFIETSGKHHLMLLRLWHEPGDEPDILRGRQGTRSLFGTLWSLEDDVILKKISSRANLRPLKIICFPDPKDTIVKPSPSDTGRKHTVVPPADAKNILPFAKNDSMALSLSMRDRKPTEVSRLKIHSDKINLKIYDNGVVDNDTVSVFYNGRLLVTHQRLSEKPIDIDIALDRNKQLHEITLFAENLGGIPPNTALIVVTAGGKRFELRSKASLDENAVLVFETE